MASRNIIPFNNQPASGDQKTSSYTVPAGFYAKVTGSFLPGQGTTSTTYTLPKLTIDGDVVLYCPSFTVSNAVAVNSTSNVFTVPSDFIGTAHIQCNVITALAISVKFNGGNVSFGSAASETSVTLGVGEGTVIFNGTGSTINIGAYGIYFSSCQPNMITKWVSSGTVLSGTAGTFKWEVELYNEIT